jgi:hypothetical protein
MFNSKSNLGIYMFAILIIAFTLNGCAKRSQFILVQSKAVETLKNDNIAEVTTTPRYSKMISQIKSVALNAPSSCENKSTSAATGTAESKGSIVKTYCGVEMAEIERALVRQGFTVYSWNMINNAIVENKKDKTPLEVAKLLGAQVLFQVNSLERVLVTPGSDTILERSFFESNEYGDVLSPLKLDENRKSEINAATPKDELSVNGKQLLGIMLDINAVDTETGQTIWFYRCNKNEDFSKNIIDSSLFQCWDNWGCQKEIAQSRNNEQTTTSEKSSTGEKYLISTSARPASEQDAIYFSLLRDATADFVKRFSSGR